MLTTIWVLVVASSVVPQGLAQSAAVSTNQAAYISGGVGDDSAERMAAIGKEYNLKLTFAARDGHYLADVAVLIKNAAGGNVLVATSEGPFLFVQLPPGKYQVTADYADKVLTRSTSVAASGRREMIFRWDEAGE
jgi:hypothetical protein